MEAQCREPAACQPARVQISLGMGAGDGAALPPQAARRFGRVIAVACARRRRSPRIADRRSPRIGVRARRQGEKRARLVERRAQRRRVHAMADEVEQVAMNSRRGVGPLAGDAGTGEADEERAPAGAVEVAGDPIAAQLAAVRQVAPADRLGLQAERGGDAGGGRRIVRHAGPP